MASCGRLAIGLPMNRPVPERGGLPTRRRLPTCPTQRQKVSDLLGTRDRASIWSRTACGFAALYYYPSYSLRAATILYSPPAVRALSQQSNA